MLYWSVRRLDQFPKCKTSLLNESGRAMRMFSYMPLIPRLRAVMSNRTYTTQLQYLSDEHAETLRPGTIMNIFDELHYRSLFGDRVVVEDRTYSHNYFPDPHDIAVCFTTDSFASQKRKHTASPFSSISLRSNASERTTLLCWDIPGSKIYI